MGLINTLKSMQKVEILETTPLAYGVQTYKSKRKTVTLELII